MPLPEIGQVLDPRAHAIPQFEHVGDIEVFEGLIFALVRLEGDLFVEKWCDCDPESGSQRTLCVPTSARRVLDYLEMKIDMREVLLAGDTGYLVDREGREGEVVRVANVRVADLPLDYLPETGAWHDAELRPCDFSVVEQTLGISSAPR